MTKQDLINQFDQYVENFQKNIKHELPMIAYDYHSRAIAISLLLKKYYDYDTGEDWQDCLVNFTDNLPYQQSRVEAHKRFVQLAKEWAKELKDKWFPKR